MQIEAHSRIMLVLIVQHLESSPRIVVKRLVFYQNVVLNLRIKEARKINFSVKVVFFPRYNVLGLDQIFVFKLFCFRLILNFYLSLGHKFALFIKHLDSLVLIDRF